MSPLLPNPSKLVKSAKGTAARLLGSTRPILNGRAGPVDLPTAPARDVPSRPGRVGKYDEALVSLVARRPGVTVAEAAGELDVHPTALYPVIRRLEVRGQLVKRGRELQPTLTADAQSPKSGAHERLWCDQGHHWWERPRSRGPKPKRCPDHR